MEILSSFNRSHFIPKLHDFFLKMKNVGNPTTLDAIVWTKPQISQHFFCVLPKSGPQKYLFEEW